MRDFNRQVTIHFNDAATAKIQRSLPEFNGVQVFYNAQADLLQGMVSITASSKEQTVDGEAVYFYPLSQIDRIKIVDLPL